MMRPRTPSRPRSPAGPAARGPCAWGLRAAGRRTPRHVAPDRSLHAPLLHASGAAHSARASQRSHKPGCLRSRALMSST